MKKYKLLYFISEDQYFLTHKINQAKDSFAKKLMSDVMFQIFQITNQKLKKSGLKLLT